MGLANKFYMQLIHVVDRVNGHFSYFYNSEDH